MPEHYLGGGDYRMVDLKQPMPRAWLVHRVLQLPELHDASPARTRDRTREVLIAPSAPKHWDAEAYVESDIPLPYSVGQELPDTSNLLEVGAPATYEEFVKSLPSFHSDAMRRWMIQRDRQAGEWCELRDVTPQHVEIDVQLARPGLVVLADMFYPGWQLTVDSGDGPRPAPILRTNRVLRGVALPAGTHRLVYEFRPWTFRVGAAISGAALCALLGLGAGAYRRRRARPAPRQG